MSIEGEALLFKSKVLRREVLQCEHLTAGGVCVSASRQLELSARQEVIMVRLERAGRVQVTELSEILGVS